MQTAFKHIKAWWEKKGGNNLSSNTECRGQGVSGIYFIKSYLG